MKDGGPAFPMEYTQPCADGNPLVVTEPGMTMRQYYKAAALTGLLATRATAGWATLKLATYAGEVADAMIAEDEEHR